MNEGMFSIYRYIVYDRMMYYLFSPALRVSSVLAGKGTLNMTLVPEQ